jgi:hypothetical protein
MAIIGQGDVKRRVSRSKKKANDFQRQKDIMDIYDLWYGDHRNEGEIKKFDMNYDLFNGRLDVRAYDDAVCLNIDGEKVKFDFKNITHYPLISQVANAMHGEIISRPFVPTAQDIGTSSTTLRDKKWNELLKELMSSEIIGPVQEEIVQRFLSQNGVQDALQLSPEQIQQLQQEVQVGVEAKTPEDILEFMENDFQTPVQREAQQLLEYFVKKEDIKYKQQEGFKHAIITGREVYYIGDTYGEPTFNLVNPKFFTWGGSQNTEWIEDATWAKYEQWLTLEEVTQKYAEYFDNRSLKELEGFAEPIGGNKAIGDPKKDFVQSRTMYELSIEDGALAQKYDSVNHRTKKGQSDIVRLYEDVIKKYGASHGHSYSNYGIRESHIVWRDKAKMYRVIRDVEGEKKTLWFDEHYEPRDEDLEVREVWVDEIWEGTKLGSTGSNDLYMNVRPLPGQYKSIFNPFGTKLPYIGRNYNSHLNNTKNVSIIDLGKPWQKEFDTTMAQVKHDMATDLGNVFLMSLQWKPENWKWEQWFDTLRNGKLLMTQAQKHGFGQIDPAGLKSVNLSKTTDIANKIQLLDYFRNNLVQSMNFNDARMGSIGQYTTNANIQQSQSASYNQTEGYFETHRKIVERALNIFMNRARILYKTNEKLKFILDDVAKTNLEISPDFWYEEWAIKFSTSSEDIRRVQELRQQMLAFVQNGMSFDGVLALTLADTPSDIVEIMKKENKRQEEQRQEAAAAQQAQFQAQLEANAKEQNEEREFKATIEKAKLDSQERRTTIDVDKFRLQNDVDRNNVADTIQKAIIELQAKQQIEAANLALANKKIEEESRLKEIELGIKDKQSEIDSRRADDEAKARREELSIKKIEAKKPKPANNNK